MLLISPMSLCLSFATLLSIARAHTVIVYPGMRGNSLHTNGTVVQSQGLGSYTTDNGTIWPYGMQWDFPCGGMPISQNRTKWPVSGGAISIQPGWFPGHSSAFFYINLGFGDTEDNIPTNFTYPMVSPFQIVGPTKDPYPGTFCLPQVPLPVNASVKAGDKATIQVIELALWGGALYNCVDIEFADPSEVAEVNEENCFNSTDIGFNLIYTASVTGAASFVSSSHLYAALPFLLAMFVFWQ